MKPDRINRKEMLRCENGLMRIFCLVVEPNNGVNKDTVTLIVLQ